MTTASLVVIFLSLALNALLACVEMAFVSVSRGELTRLAGQGLGSAHRLLKLRNNPERTLSVLQVGISLVGAVSAAVGGAGAEESLGPRLESFFGWSEQSADAAAVGLVVVPLTFLNVVLGELVPKTLALRNPLKLALGSAVFLQSFERILAPLVFVLEQSTKAILALLPKAGAVASEDAAADFALSELPDAQREYVNKMLALNKVPLSQILLPWEKVDQVSEEWDWRRIRDLLLSSGHTRFPVTQNGVAVGILNAKEFMTFAGSGETQWQSLVRPVLSVNSTDSVTSVLKLLQKSRNHMTLVNSPDGKLLGILTLEGIFEEIIGDIFDEDDDDRLRRMLATNPRYRALQRGVRA